MKQQNVRQANTLNEYAKIAFPRDSTVCIRNDVKKFLHFLSKIQKKKKNLLCLDALIKFKTKFTTNEERNSKS